MNHQTAVKHLVSVLIVTYNSEQYIVDCLKSLQMQDYQPAEIIVYDNASSDDTTNLIQTHFPAIKLIISKTNLGFATANNLAADQAKGKFLAFLNPDTIVEPNWLQPLIETLTANAAIGAVTPQIVFADDPSRVNTCGNTIHLSGITYCQQYNQPLIIGEPYTVSAVSGAAFVISQKLFEDLGGFEERFFMYYEDTDLSWRIHCAGFSCTAVPGAIVSHAYKPTFSAQKIFYLERNRYLSLFSLTNWQIFLLMLPSLLLMEAVSWGYVFLQGRQAVAAKWQAWAALVQSKSWIANRRQKQGCLQPKNLIPIFSSRLQTQYVTNSNPLLLRSVETVAWLLAAPALQLANWMFK